MVVPIVLCPSWSIESPPYSLAILKAILGREGFKAVCYDLNIELYNHINDGLEKQSWLGMIKGKCWTEPEFVSGIFNKYIDFIETYIKNILQQDGAAIGLSVNQRNYIFTIEIAKKIKQYDKGKIIIVGGPLCFRNDRCIEILKEPSVDAICIGEGERSFPNILRIIEQSGGLGKCRGIAFRGGNGGIEDGGDEPLLDDLDRLPFADFSDFEISDYKKKMLPTLIGRGCINKCVFCSEWERFRSFRSRSAANVYEEIKHQKEKYPFIEELIFNDSLLNGNMRVLNGICDLLIENKVDIKWGGQAVIRDEMTASFLKKMRKAGCYYLSYGVESGSDDILRSMRKNFTAALASRIIRETRDSGMNESFNIIVGFPGEDEKRFSETGVFIKNNMEYVNMITINPLYLSRELVSEKEKWGISIPKNGDSDAWASRDGSNNEEVRFRRLKSLRELVTNKLSIDFDIELEYYLKRGDRLFNEGNRKEAKRFYLKAREANKDDNFQHIIEEKIRLCICADIIFNWNLHYKCNFRCPYCWLYEDSVRLHKRDISLDQEYLLDCWKKVYDKYGRIPIEITGGEPFLYPGLAELSEKLSGFHDLTISTNLSADIEDFVRRIDPSRVKISPTFHPLFAEFEPFVKKSLRLKEHHFTECINYLAYPSQMELINYYKERFGKAGLLLSVKAFQGEYRGILYPDGYTEEEKKLIDKGPALAPDGAYIKDIPETGRIRSVVRGNRNIINCDSPGLSEMVERLLDKDLWLPIKEESGRDNRPLYLKNKELNRSEVRERKAILESKPQILNLIVSNQCNLNCIMCYSSRKSGGKTLDNSVLKKIYELSPYLIRIIWQGGEIFCVDHLKEIFSEMAVYHQITHEIITNGLLLDEEWLRILLNLNLSFGISIDSAEEKTYEYIRRGARFDLLKNRLKLLSDIEKGSGKRMEKIIYAVVMRSNYQKLDSLVDLAEEYAFQKIIFSPVLFMQDNPENIFSGTDQEARYNLEKSFEEVKRKALSLGVGVSSTVPDFIFDLPGMHKHENGQPGDIGLDLDKQGLFCVYPWKQLCVDVSREGNIYADCWCRVNIGNIYKDDLLEAWNNRLMSDYRGRLAAGDKKWCEVCVDNNRTV